MPYVYQRSPSSDGVTYIKGDIITNGGIYINSASPTIYLQDTDNQSGMIHMNSGYFYIL